MELQTTYLSKKCSPEQLAEQIESGWSCCCDIALAAPPAILQALGERAVRGESRSLRIHSILDLGSSAHLSAEAAAGITPVSWFSGGGLRRAVNEGRGDIMPCYYQDMPALFSDHTDVDVFLAAVSPMDQHGYFSVGATSSNSEVLLKKAKHIFIEVNDRMPRTLTGPQIHITQVTALCEHSRTLPAVPPIEIDDVSRTIGELISEEVPNGATFQLGIGAIPEAVGIALKDKHELGIHTELFTDSMVGLIESGVVTNTRKPIYYGKNVATFAFGSQRIYDYINNNPSFVLLPVNQCNDPSLIARHPNFISVNSAVEVDFFGQVCAESVGARHISGTGGQVDYVRGAVASKGGKSFIAFSSTAQSGAISRIVPMLTHGAVVTTSKNDVDYIATEYGIAKLRGKTLAQRTKALISIAHPKFREELTHSAKKQNIMI